MIDIRQLRYFVTVAETLHFGRAAERLHVTQPPLSRQVAALEKELGVQLLKRDSRHAQLTKAGEQFLTDSRAVLTAFDQACSNAKRAGAGELGEISVGFVMHAAYSSVPPLTRRFIAAQPGVRLHLREAMPLALLEGLLNGNFDAIVTFGLAKTIKGVSSVVIHREPLCLAIPELHPLDGHQPVSPDMLAHYPILAAPVSITPSMRQSIADYYARAGLEPEIRLETQLQQTIVSLVAEGIGVALVPQSLQKLGIRGVKFRPLVDAPLVDQALAWRTDNLNPTLPHFLATAQPIVE